MFFSFFVFFLATSQRVHRAGMGVCHDVVRARGAWLFFLRCLSAVPVLVCIISRKIEAGAPGRHDIFDQHVVRAGGSSTWLLIFCCGALSVVFLFLICLCFVATLKEGNED